MTELLQFFEESIPVALMLIFVENIVLTYALDTSTALIVVRKKNNILLFGGILTAILFISSIILYFLRPVLAQIPDISYYRPLIYLSLIAILYLISLVISRLLGTEFRKKVQPMIHISAFNSTILGVLLLESAQELTLGGSVGYAIGAGFGFMLACWLISVVYEYLYSEAIPRAFRGFPVLLIYVGLLSLILYGLLGHLLPY